MPMPHTLAARDAVLRDPASTVLALDFDGTLAHIVDDPAKAFAQKHAVDSLARLGSLLGHVAIITGRPVQQALELGGFADHSGLDSLVIFGQYGAERWDAATGEVKRFAADPQIDIVRQMMTDWLNRNHETGIRIEDKRLAIAVHTRGLAEGVYEKAVARLTNLAQAHGLEIEEGRQVVELRSPGTDKGDVLRNFVVETGAKTVVFAGDDLGDLPAFAAVKELRSDGMNGLLICSASAEQDALQAQADVILDGPDAVADWLGSLADDLELVVS